MKTGRYNIAQLLTSPEMEQIIIPELQRDYVWGARNVTGLLTSILDNYDSMNEQKLEIKDGLGNVISEDIMDYLNEEYMRLRFNTRVGFIYAYHDRTLVGQYYLIDGQQRITTIFLILLALYRRSEHPERFRKLYFVAKLPKIDYKVREVAHSFLVDFIEFELNKKKTEDTFEESSRYYSEYNKDVTAQSIYQNYYQVIVPCLAKYDDVESLIYYVENYIEFNYFDTNMSEQGEKLYLYMNSRGESLSNQERIKSVIIGRSSNKLDAGRIWEDWQNFFWRTKSPHDQNADRGFFEFLKWAVIIHMCTFPDSKLKKTESVDKNKSRTEEIEDYIRIEKDASLRQQQTDWICTYISVNENITFEWLQQVETAVECLHKLLQTPKFQEWGFEVDPWFYISEETNTIEYTSLLGLLYYIKSFHELPNNELNTLRMAMYLKNLKSEYTLRRVPDNAVIRCLRLVDWMVKNHVSDIRLLGKYAMHAQDGFNDRYVLRLDDLRWGYYQMDWQNSQSVHPQRDEIGQWELFFWKIIENTGLNRFLRGNHDFVVKVMHQVTMPPTLFQKLFIENIYKQRNQNSLRQALLKYGDISVVDGGGGSSNIPPNNWMKRWCLLDSNRDESYWYDFMYGEKADTHAKIVSSYLQGNEIAKISDSVFEALGNSCEYMHQKFFLWDEENHLRVIILQEKQASIYKARELCVQYLHSQIPDSLMWIHNFCVINFAATSEGLVQTTEPNSGYYVDLWYDWHPEGGVWFCRIGHKLRDLSDNLIHCIQKQIVEVKGVECNWKIEKTERICLRIDGSIYTEKPSDDYLTGASFVKALFDDLWTMLKAINKVEWD